MFNKSLLATTALVAFGIAGVASAVDVEMYGQVNKGVMVFDDGKQTDSAVVDNDNSSTRLGFKGSQVLDNGLTASVLFEVEMQSNASDVVVQNTNNAGAGTGGLSSTPANAGGTFAERHARVGIAGDWGALFAGQMSTASANTAEQDLVGVGDLMGADINSIGGGLKFRLATGSHLIGGSARTVNQLTGDIGNDDLADSVRYDSPIWNGFQVRASHSQGGDFDLGAFYNGQIDAFAIAAAAGYKTNGDVANGNAAALGTNIVDSDSSLSVSAKHDSGIAGTVAFGSREISNKVAGTDDPSFTYVKGGYAWDAFEVAADYGIWEEFLGVAADHELTGAGIGGQYNMGNGVSAAVGYRQFDVDYTGANTDTIDIYTANMRVKF